MTNELINGIRRHHAAYAPELADARIGTVGATLKGERVLRKRHDIEGIISTHDVDMDGQVVLSERFDTTYFPDRVKAVYLNHDYSCALTGGLPIGTCRELVYDESIEALRAVTHVTEKRQIGHDLIEAIDEGAINGLSIAFKPDSVRPTTPEEKGLWGEKALEVVEEGSFIEYSFTPMPANPGALVQMMRKSRISRESAVAFGLDDSAERRSWPTHGPAGGGAVKGRTVTVDMGRTVRV